MPVSGVVISCLQGKADDVAGKITAMDGIEIHGVLPDGRIVAVVEADTVDDEVELVTELQKIEDVISVQMAYHNFEDLGVEQP